MSKIEMTPLELLKWCHFGLTQGNAEAVPGLLMDAIKQIEKLEAENAAVCPTCGGTGRVAVEEKPKGEA